MRLENYENRSLITTVSKGSEINATHNLRNSVGNGPVNTSGENERFELPPRALLLWARGRSNEHGLRL